MCVYSGKVVDRSKAQLVWLIICEYVSIIRCFLYFLVRLLYIWGRLLPQAQCLFSAHCQSYTETSLISDPQHILLFAFAFDFNWEWMPFDSAHPVALLLLIVVFVVTSLWFSIPHCHRVQLSLKHIHKRSSAEWLWALFQDQLHSRSLIWSLG